MNQSDKGPEVLSATVKDFENRRILNEVMKLSGFFRTTLYVMICENVTVAVVKWVNVYNVCV